MVVRTKLEVHSLQIHEKKEGTQFFCVANDIPLQVCIPKEKMNEIGMEEAKKLANAMMLNSMRYIKHTGNLPLMIDPTVLNKWSSTDMGIAIKPKNDMIKEFPRFL